MAKLKTHNPHTPLHPTRTEGPADAVLLRPHSLWHLRAGQPHPEHHVRLHEPALQGGQRGVPRRLRSPGRGRGGLRMLVRAEVEFNHCRCRTYYLVAELVFLHFPPSTGSPTLILQNSWSSTALERTTLN